MSDENTDYRFGLAVYSDDGEYRYEVDAQPLLDVVAAAKRRIDAGPGGDSPEAVAERARAIVDLIKSLDALPPAVRDLIEGTEVDQ